MRPILYLTAEIGLEPGLPTYAGGLGVLAGDHVRSAADLDLPLTAVSLYYREGYGLQNLDEEGAQTLSFPRLEPDRVLEPGGFDLSIEINGESIQLATWKREVTGLNGHTITVWFLDAGLPQNDGSWQRVSERLYGGGPENRLRQELILGFGGLALAEALGMTDQMQLHLNEGHTAFAGYGLAKRYSLEKVRARCLFTTHTPVSAGHDRFDWEMVRNICGSDLTEALTALVPGDRLNMSHLAAAHARAINGVSVTNAQVAQDLFPNRDLEAVTNGVHLETWCMPPMLRLFDDCLPGWREDQSLLAGAVDLPDEALGAAREQCRRELVQYVNAQTQAGLREDLPVLGFARRMTGYKRANLILRDSQRLEALAEQFGGLQIVFAGRAHPRDTEGQGIIRALTAASKATSPRLRIAMLPNYSMWSGRLLTGGVDLWLNNPIRPLEASGTSGMKASFQGVPNLSILDGWWVEGCRDGENGFAFGSEEPSRDDPGDAEALYDCLQKRVLPLVTAKDVGPWRAMQKQAILTAQDFSSRRMVSDYAERYYRQAV